MYDPKKSDTGIVAMKPTNDADRSVTEPVEQRPVTNGNRQSQSTDRTQSRVPVSQAAERIRQFVPICRQPPKVGAVCVNAHVRICAGGAGQPASLPRKSIERRPLSGTSAAKSREKPAVKAPSAAKPHRRADAKATSAAKSERNPAANGTSPANSPTKPARAITSAPRERGAGRSIPQATKRQVWQRDGGGCRYVDRVTGQRCTSRHLLQMDHIVPYALGGGADPDNLRLLCAAYHRHRHAARARIGRAGPVTPPTVRPTRFPQTHLRLGSAPEPNGPAPRSQMGNAQHLHARADDPAATMGAQPPADLPSTAR